MRKLAPVLVLRLALLVAIFACAVLVVEYENAGDPAFCGVGSGCMAVRRSPYSQIADVPLPVIGLCAHAGLLALVLVARDKSQTFFTAAAGAFGAVTALGLLALQALKIGAFCKWCVLVDASSIVAGLAAALVHRLALDDARYEDFLTALSKRRAQVVAWGAGAAIVAGMPFLWNEYPSVPPAPPAIAALSVPGKTTIVSFTDFQCPYCRKLAPVLHEIQDNWGERMTLVRKMAPLAGHPGAMPAALAYLCTPEASREEMAQKLYAAPADVLKREGLIALADKMKLDVPVFARCMDAPETKAQVEADRALFDQIGGGGLPLTYFGPRVVAGYNPIQARKIGQIVMEGDRLALKLSWLFVAAALVAAALIAATLRMTPRDEESTSAQA
jgi:uncharacterized membrane protein/predicted DsbA family dithiol-disulfide isomerase